ncbi:MAG TPA: hypothetical protein VGB85_17100 [Nannocystis sp.]|jgi:hypothetical protein
MTDGTGAFAPSSSLRAWTLVIGVVSLAPGCNREPAATQPTAPATPAASTPPATVAAPVAAPTPATPTPPVEPVVAVTEPVKPLACPPNFPADRPLSERLDLAKQACGALLLVTRETGIAALTSDLVPIAELTKTAGRHLRTHLAGDARQLHYFAADRPDLMRLDLRTGTETVLATLPKIDHACFTDGEPADPVEYIQEDADLGLDVDGGVLCINISDANVNMMSAGFNYRVDLTTKKVERRMTSVGEECKQPRDREQKPLCQPHEVGPQVTHKSTQVPGSEELGEPSSSGRYIAYRNTDLGDQGDYIYSAILLYDTTTRTHLAVTSAGPRPVDLAKLKTSADLPPKTCKIPGEASMWWMPDRDVLILENCGDSPFLIVRPEGRTEPLAAQALAFHE